MTQNQEQKIFNLEFLQAINDWQCGGDAKQNQRRGVRLEKLCAKLPEKYRSCSLLCFRQIALPKGGVPPQGQRYQGVIFSAMPTKENTVVNLRELYQCPEFQLAIKQHCTNIGNYDKGIRRYMDTQSEVVLKIESVNQEGIYSLGGHSSPFEELVNIASEVIYGRIATVEEKEALLLKVENCRAVAGPSWLSMDATIGVVNRTKPKAEKLARIKKLQSA